MGRQKKKRLQFYSLLMSLAMALTLIVVPHMEVRAEDSGVGGFVNRCYQVALGREADPTGYADWTGQLSSGKADGSVVAFGFVYSDEYKNANKNNGDFVTDMYTLFLGRTPDEAGYKDWVGQLDSGADRMNIFYGFANSKEFYSICSSYGVTAGYFTPDYDKDQVNAVNMFVARMYRICLGRLGDQDGQADWTAKLLRGELTGNDCAHGFIFSNEYVSLGLSDEDYVKNLYRTFMGREYDQGGFDNWVGKLKSGYTRDEVFSGFANSNEFQEICNSYGIIRGDYTPSEVHDENNGNEQSEHGWRVTKKTYSNGQYSLYSYNHADAYPSKVVRYRANGSEIGMEQLNEYGSNSGKYGFADYDEQGNCTMYEVVAYEQTNDSGQGFTEKGTKYDQNNNVVGYVETQFAHFESAICPVEQRDYDVNHKLESYRKTQWSNDGKRELKAEVYRADNTLRFVYENTYDKYGNKTVETDKFYESDGVTISFTYKTTYEYAGPNGQISKSVRYGTNGQMEGWTSYFYNNGKLIRTEAYSADGKKLESKTELEYDNNGNTRKTTVTSYGYSGGKVVNTKVTWTTTEYERY